LAITVGERVGEFQHVDILPVLLDSSLATSPLVNSLDSGCVKASGQDGVIALRYPSHVDFRRRWNEGKAPISHASLADELAGELLDS
jgi:hypothetical protein